MCRMPGVARTPYVQPQWVRLLGATTALEKHGAKWGRLTVEDDNDRALGAMRSELEALRSEVAKLRAIIEDHIIRCPGADQPPEGRSA